MYGLIEIHIGFTIISNIYNYGKFPQISGNFLLVLNFRKIYNPKLTAFMPPAGRHQAKNPALKQQRNITILLMQ